MAEQQLGKYQLCPLCQDVSKVSGGYFGRAGDYLYWWSATNAIEECRICGGDGVIVRPVITKEESNGK